ncbi:MAG: Spy/CpxP family protein refolding chaperone [Bordetella sp.]|uniref:Spy/CpxP family protein refolding chaperone n=1 Tax=Bordetella sp. TaxID=28081 RepID=UPI003F7B992E
MFALASATAPAQPANDAGTPSSGAYGPGYHMGAGMMGGRGGGYGMGPWMMDDDETYGGWGMGPWMMGGYFGPGSRALASLDLSEAQIKKIETIRDASEKKQWALMTAMHDAMLAERDSLGRQSLDIEAQMKTAKAMSDIRLQMLRNRLEAQKQISDALTPQQQEQWRRYGGRRW